MKINGFGCTCIGMLLLAAAIKVQAQTNSRVKLITLDPGHFHAALVQKTMLPDIDPVVYVYAPKGDDVQAHLDKITAYNSRKDNATAWKEEVYLGDDFFERMIAEKKGNVVVMAGNNHRKTDYIKKAIDAGFNVLGDKPMAIDNAHFLMLKAAFVNAAKKKLVLYDIMTERYEITNALQRELTMLPQIFGTLKKGTPRHPGIEMESVHYFYKSVSGSALTRPAWFFDVTQQGEGLQDVGVHLVDLAQWECFPNRVINYQKDIQFNSARHWTSDVSLNQFKTITKHDFPAYLHKSIVNDTILKVYANGMVNYKLFGVNIKLTAKWAYQAIAGGDSQYAMVRGSKADVVVKQGAAENYSPVLYIKPVHDDMAYEKLLQDNWIKVQADYPGVTFKKEGDGYTVIIPDHYKDGHEAHFGRVTELYLDYLRHGNMPTWEVPNMIAKYYITTTALELARK